MIISTMIHIRPGAVLEHATVMVALVIVYFTRNVRTDAEIGVLAPVQMPMLDNSAMDWTLMLGTRRPS